MELGKDEEISYLIIFGGSTACGIQMDHRVKIRYLELFYTFWNIFLQCNYQQLYGEHPIWIEKSNSTSIGGIFWNSNGKSGDGSTNFK